MTDDEKKFDFSYPLTDLEMTMHSGWLDNLTIPNAPGVKHSDKVMPHPDGQPWPSCCCDAKYGPKCCAYVDTETITGMNRVDNGMYYSKEAKDAFEGGGRFFCAHRNDQGYTRVCHGWAVRDGNGWKGPKRDLAATPQFGVPLSAKLFNFEAIDVRVQILPSPQQQIYFVDYMDIDKCDKK
jgi:hypothetical protein